MTDNLFAGLPDQLPEELTNVLLEEAGARIERIVSTGQASPPGFWYNQSQTEWVVVLRGSARLRMEGQKAELCLSPGDHVILPAGCRHRIEWTSPTEPTVWLAVFLPASSQPQ